MGLRDEAAELALAVELGFDSVAEAVDWADGHIAALDQPPYALIEVSLAAQSHPHDVAQLLHTLAGVAAPEALRRLIARMISALDEGHAKAEKIGGVLDAMHRAGLFNEAAAQEWARLEWAGDLAHDGIGTFEDAAIDLGQFLKLCAGDAE